MEMEFMAEFTEGMSRDRALQIIKGKRTKRQRPCSPFGNFTPDRQSPEISTEEDEDMANCLIMLAQSVSPIIKEENSDQIRQKTDKLTSRRLTEMTATATTAGGKFGYYVYECKTCNRTFPSFQALGGHRASHKKPKINVEEKNIPSPLTEYSEEDHGQQKTVIEDEENKTSMIINNNVQSGNTITNNKRKAHECSICGSEFSSGQALGGHMRKHRPVPPSVNRTEKSPAGSTSTLSLDLNFPPPEVADDVVQSKFQFTTGSSQQHMVFSSPALVDCHY